jgi:hypothetical protein
VHGWWFRVSIIHEAWLHHPTRHGAREVNEDTLLVCGSGFNPSVVSLDYDKVEPFQWWFDFSDVLKVP